MNRKPGRHPAAMIFAACLAFQAAMLPAGSPAIAAAPPNRARAVHPAGTRANRPDAMAYWSGRPRFGANCMDTTPPTTAYLRAARAQGIQWIRLAWDKWRPARRDFLLGRCRPLPGSGRGRPGRPQGRPGPGSRGWAEGGPGPPLSCLACAGARTTAGGSTAGSGRTGLGGARRNASGPTWPPDCGVTPRSSRTTWSMSRPRKNHRGCPKPPPPRHGRPGTPGSRAPPRTCRPSMTG